MILNQKANTVSKPKIKKKVKQQVLIYDEKYTADHPPKSEIYDYSIRADPKPNKQNPAIRLPRLIRITI
jgi:hypothetical protein